MLIQLRDHDRTLINTETLIGLQNVHSPQMGAYGYITLIFPATTLIIEYIDGDIWSIDLEELGKHLVTVRGK